ncbi:hypothetical protein M885DRAFT_502262 [Pelagophyceae sp. CCMP2097]|nr:hypothetical protein M885DRAFT_502262 [Pelagophyceae sp. CCMP2097]
MARDVGRIHRDEYSRLDEVPHVVVCFEDLVDWAGGADSRAARAVGALAAFVAEDAATDVVALRVVDARARGAADASRRPAVDAAHAAESITAAVAWTQALRAAVQDAVGDPFWLSYCRGAHDARGVTRLAHDAQGAARLAPADHHSALAPPRSAPAGALRLAPRPGGVSIPAVTNTYDARLPFVAFMLAQYAALWPSHPFTFHVPYNDTRAFDSRAWRDAADTYGARLVRVRAPRDIAGTVRALLLACRAGGDMVFWAPDDMVPWVDADRGALDAVVDAVSAALQGDLFGLALAYTDGVWGKAPSERVRQWRGAPLLFVPVAARDRRGIGNATLQRLR